MALVILLCIWKQTEQDTNFIEVFNHSAKQFSVREKLGKKSSGLNVLNAKILKVFAVVSLVQGTEILIILWISAGFQNANTVQELGRARGITLWTTAGSC